MRQREILLKQQLNLIRVMLLAIGVYQLLMQIMGVFGKQKKMALKLLNSAQLINKYQIFFIGIYLTFLGQGRYEEALESINKALQRKEYGSTLGFRASLLGHLEKGSEAKMVLDTYLALRPNLKTREDYRNSFITNSVLADTIIEGLIKAGWNPED